MPVDNRKFHKPYTIQNRVRCRTRTRLAIRNRSAQHTDKTFEIKSKCNKSDPQNVCRKSKNNLFKD